MTATNMPGRKVTGGSGGGAEPDPKKRRILDAGGPIEDDETARQKMRDAEVYERGVESTRGEFAGFDPENVGDVKSWSRRDADRQDSHATTPMDYFAERGDLPMMRWLYVNGANTRDDGTAHWFPMFRAALWGHLDICKWLFQHGAAGDIKRRTRNGSTPLSATFDESDKRNVSRWLILRGALCKDDESGELDVGLVRYSLGQISFEDYAEEWRELLQWAKEHVQSRVAFDVFLMGTLSAPTYSVTKLRESLLARIRSEQVVGRILRNTPQDEYHLLWDGLFPRRDCPLAAFTGKSGILELIGDYLGIMRGRDARIVRQLTERLPGVIVDLAVGQAESSDDSDDSD